MMKTFGNGLRFVLVLALVPLTATNLCTKSPVSTTSDGQEWIQLTVSVYNEAEVPEDVVDRAEEQAEQVFQQTGIEVAWLNCKVPAVSGEASRACREAVFPQHLHLRIVRKSLGLKAEALGISFQAGDGSGCYADLFYEPMERLHKSEGTDLASLLGHVAAHEIGHLLLGANSHSATGIMHAHWTAEELASAKAGGLVFSEQESRRMRAKLATAMQASKERPLNESPREPATKGELPTLISLIRASLRDCTKGQYVDRPQGRRAGQNSHLSLGNAKTDPFRAWDVRGGFLGERVSNTRRTGAELGIASFR